MAAAARDVLLVTGDGTVTAVPELIALSCGTLRDAIEIEETANHGGDGPSDLRISMPPWVTPAALQALLSLVDSAEKDAAARMLQEHNNRRAAYTFFDVIATANFLDAVDALAILQRAIEGGLRDYLADDENREEHIRR
eukprot:1205508-Prymnesium_polylepis.1